jgi:hypothetical protein
MSRQRFEPKIYKNQQLMNEFNNMLVNIKMHMFVPSHAKNYPKPTEDEIDNIANRIFGILRQDNEPMIKR